MRINSLRFRKLTIRDNLIKVAKLLLSHDLDYHFMIGEFDDNLDVMLKLINDSDSIFYYNNYYVVEDLKTGNLVGLGSFRGYKKEISNSFIYTRAFGELNKTLPPKFEEVFNATFKMFNTMVLGGLMCQVIVDENYRRQGIGSYMMKNMLNLYGKAPSFLWVTKDNVAAVKLYSKFDYIPVDEFVDFSEEKEGRKELKMFREGSDKYYE